LALGRAFNGVIARQNVKVSAAGAVVIKNCVTVNVMVAAAVQISKYDMLDTLKINL